MVLMQNHSRMYIVLRQSVIALTRHSTTKYQRTQCIIPTISTQRFIQTSQNILNNKKTEKKALAVFAFDHVNKKEKETFLDVLHMYESQETARKGHVEFINAAMNYMDEFGVNEDLDVYKRLIDVMPKGKFISTSPLHADFMYYPKQQQCIIDLLEKMEHNGVIPDVETEQMLLNIFGQFGIPLRKFWRMMYWMPKFRNLNPWPTPRPVPTDALILAKIAIEKIASVDVQSEVVVFETETIADSIDKTWIVSASSPDQEKLMQSHPENVACYVEGPFKIWVAHMPVDYYILRAEPRPLPKSKDVDNDDVSKFDVLYWDKPELALGEVRSVHEQEDATIYSVCATGTSSKDSLLSWIRCLQKRNPILEKIPVLFKLTKQIPDQQTIEAGVDGKTSTESVKKIQDN